MKRMKRWLAMLLVVVLVASTLTGNCMTAYAAELPVENGGTEFSSDGTETTNVDSTTDTEEPVIEEVVEEVTPTPSLEELQETDPTPTAMVEEEPSSTEEVTDIPSATPTSTTEVTEVVPTPVVETEELPTPSADVEATPIVEKTPVTEATPTAEVSPTPSATPTAEVEEMKYPAIDFGSFNVSGMKVTISAPEGAFAEGTTVSVNEVSASTAMNLVEDVVDESVEIAEVKAVDITFTDKDGKEVQPLVPISVLFSQADLEGSSFAVYHADGNDVEKVADLVCADGGVISVDSFSMYVLVGVNSVNIGEMATYTMYQGETIKVYADTTNTNGSFSISGSNNVITLGNKEIYESKYPAVNVTANRTGEATITYKSGSYQQTIKIIVKDKITVSFDTDGGNGSAPSTINAVAGTEITMPSYSGTKEGYVFVGWAKNKNVNSSGNYDSGADYIIYPAGSKYIVVENKKEWWGTTDKNKFYAIWASVSGTEAEFYIRKESTIPYEPQGYDPSDFSEGIKIKNAIKVASFYTNQQGVEDRLNVLPSDEQIKKVRSDYNPETDYILWYVIKKEATWHVDGVLLKKELVNLTYDPNAGEVTVSNMPVGRQYAVGATATVDTKEPSRTGYTFDGWNTSPDGSGTKYTGNNTFTINANTTLYAQWVADSNTKYVVERYNADNGQLIDKVERNAVTDSVAHATDADKVLAGYSFIEDHASNVLSGVVAADGSLVLKLYFSKQYGVTYSWTNAPTGEYAQTLPTDSKKYVKGEKYNVDTTFTSATVVYSKDVYGNNNGKWTFSGWTLVNNGVMPASDVELMGTWTYEELEVETGKVTYSWTGEPTGEYAQVLPTDDTEYFIGQTYAVDEKFVKGTTVEHKDAYGNVDGRWTFGGWAVVNNQKMKAGGIELKGEWIYEAVTVEDYGVTYSWTNAPTGEYAQTLPTDTNRYVKGEKYNVDKTFTSATVVYSQDAYGNNNGKWTFSGWTLVNNGVMPAEDVVLEGTWSFEELAVATGKVIYSWTGEPTEEGYIQTLPTDDTEYFIGQTYEVDETFVNGTTVEHRDAYGNVDGRWTFGGWAVVNNQKMKAGGVELKGEWTYEEVTVADYGVTYSWNNAPTGEYVQTLPTDSNRYVKGQTYDVDTTFTSETVVYSKDAYGNNNGKWTFSGWTLVNNGVMPAEDVVLEGTWSFEELVVATGKVTYSWTNEPTGEYAQVLPTDETEYFIGQIYAVDETFVNGTTVEHKDAYGNVDGRWTFGGWAVVNDQKMKEGGVELKGEWTYEAVAVEDYGVTYSWTNAPTGEYAQTLPTDSKKYVKGQTYDVDTTFTSETVVYSQDAYGNNNGKWTFSGWTLVNNGVMPASDVELKGTWTYEDMEVATGKVTYSWTNEPTGEYAQVLPTDDTEYFIGQTYAVDETFVKGTTVEHKDAYGNVDGRWTFGGWAVVNDQKMKEGGVELKGEWTYEEVTVADYGVTYSWNNAPTGEYVQTLPTDSNRYVKGQTYDVDKTFTSATVVYSQDAYGNNNGKWTFSGWTVVNNGVMPAEDVVLEGTWNFEELTVATGKVTYSWTGEPTEEGYIQTLPTDDTEYFIGQTYAVDEKFVKGTTVEHKDAYGNVDGRWTFGGWAVVNNQKMKAGGIELKGEWIYEAVTVEDYGVTYSWTNAPTGEYAQTLPTDTNRYVKGQTYDVDTTFTSETVVYSQDAYGNNNGKWTFSGWTVVNNGVMPAEDVVLEGTWNFEELTVATGKVTYSWTGEPTEEGYIQTLPTDDTEYFIGQTYAVDEKFVNGTTVEHKDAYGNVDGRWTFGGWSVAENIPAETMSVYAATATTTTTDVMVEGGILLVGDWTYETAEVQTYTVTYYVDGELYGEVETYVYNQPVNALRANPERSGYTFSGWDVTELPERMPAYNIEVYGTFKKNATPIPVPTPVPGDDPEPTPDPVVIIEDEPVPMTDQPVPTDDQQVLGARRGNDQAVLGARRGTEYAVLGKRRRPETGDSMEMIVWLITLGMSMATALMAVMKMQKSSIGKKSNE